MMKKLTYKYYKKWIITHDNHNVQSHDHDLMFFFFFFLIGIHSVQGWTATTRHGVTRKEAQKRLQDTENQFTKNPQLKDVC